MAFVKNAVVTGLKFGGGFVGYGGMGGLTPSRGTVEKLIQRSIQVHKDCGGTKFDSINNDLNEEDFRGMTKFDAHKLVLHRCLKEARETIKELRHAGRNFQSHERLKNQVRKAVRLCEIRMKEIREWHKKTTTPTALQRFFKKSPMDNKLVRARMEEIEIMQQHVDEVKSLATDRYRPSDYKDPKNPKYRQNDSDRKKVKKLLDDSDSSDSDSDKSSDSEQEIEMREINFEGAGDEDFDTADSDEEYDRDPTESKLPKIDISVAVKVIKDNKKELGVILSKFHEKLDTLHEMVLEIGNLLDEQSELIDEVQGKVAEQKERLEDLNEKADKAVKQSFKGLRLIALTYCYICCTMILVIAYFLLLQTGILSW